VIGSEAACSVISAFDLLSIEVEVFAWLDRFGVAPRTAVRAASIWGTNAIRVIEADPYVLNLLENWSAVDQRALRLGLFPTDLRRLTAAIQEVGAQAWSRGHTCFTRREAVQRARGLLTGCPELAVEAFDLAVSAGILLQTEGLPESWQTRASFAMERTVESQVSRRALVEEADTPDWVISSAISTVETELGYDLTSEQRNAVFMVMRSKLSCISGGAGTGKTTVLRAIRQAHLRRCSFEKHVTPVWQIAVSGRAAKRMSEATGASAMTVYSFLKQLSLGKIKDQAGLLIVDEASMIDLPTAYRLLTAIPEQVAICWIGDQGQLPPIGPGLFFHRLITASAVDTADLCHIHRQSTSSSIPRVAAAVRAGVWPDIAPFKSSTPLVDGVSIAVCDETSMLRTTLQVWEAIVGSPSSRTDAAAQSLHSANTQIICPTRTGRAGAKEISAAIEHRWMADQRSVHGWGVSIGSKLLWLQNDYNRESGRHDDDGSPETVALMNGMLGIVSEVTPQGALVHWDDDQQLEIKEKDLQKFERGWSITVHKAQGSAWDRVIVPVTKSRLLDRTLIYTALTRARRSVVLVGCPAILRAAIEAPPFADRRRVALAFG
jgi:exodeoxyribonuclease V alpha subunit